MTFFLSSVLDNLTSTIVMVSLLRKLVPPSEYRKYVILYIFFYLLLGFIASSAPNFQITLAFPKLVTNPT